MGMIETTIAKAKELFDLAKKADNIEIQQRVLDLQSDMLELQNEHQAVMRENEALKAARQLDSELIIRENAYWRDDAPETRQGPFCTKCYDVDGKLIRLKIREDHAQRCPSCGGFFDTTLSNAAASRAAAEHEAHAKRQRDAWSRTL